MTTTPRMQRELDLYRGARVSKKKKRVRFFAKRPRLSFLREDAREGRAFDRRVGFARCCFARSFFVVLRARFFSIALFFSPFQKTQNL